MVAPIRSPKVLCTVICIPPVEEAPLRATNRLSCRPSELLPWADPYISKLVRQLQAEVHQEHKGKRALQCELEPPHPAIESDWEWRDENRWPLPDDSF